MNIVHSIVVKNSFYILEPGRTIQTTHFSLILRTKNLVKFVTQQLVPQKVQLGPKLTKVTPKIRPIQKVTIDRKMEKSYLHLILISEI